MCVKLLKAERGMIRDGLRAAVARVLVRMSAQQCVGGWRVGACLRSIVEPYGGAGDFHRSPSSCLAFGMLPPASQWRVSQLSSVVLF